MIHLFELQRQWQKQHVYIKILNRANKLITSIDILLIIKLSPDVEADFEAYDPKLPPSDVIFNNNYKLFLTLSTENTQKPIPESSNSKISKLYKKSTTNQSNRIRESHATLHSHPSVMVRLQQI